MNRQPGVFRVVFLLFLLSFMLVACNGGGSGSNDDEEEQNNTPNSPANTSDVSVEIDATLQAAEELMPALDSSGIPRRVSIVQDDQGKQVKFVENEILLMTDNVAELDDFLSRWGGQVIDEIDTDGIAGVDLPAIYLIRVSATPSDAETLSEHLADLNTDAGGSVSISSGAGLDTLSAVAEAALNGNAVAVNWVGEGQTIATRSVIEAPVGNAQLSSTVDYSPNVFDWNYMNAGSAQDFGVTEAWFMLDRTERINNRVSIGILDMGYFSDLDIPAPFASLSNVPFTDAMGTTNLASCGGGLSCPWHGANVAEAAFGLPDNGSGAAGPAGPIANPVLVFTSYDFFTSINAIAQAVISGARIVNMSFGARVPASLTFSVLPFDRATVAFRSAGVLLFAAAGNEGEDVDDGLLWEDAWHTPCENNGVICVGGVGIDTLDRDPGSNYGGENVDIFAPYSVFVSRDPQVSTTAPDVAVLKSGTSFASPYAAGVAGLIWAANPSLTASQVESILLETSRLRQEGRRTNRIISAQAAVRRALGTIININRPTNGRTVLLGRNISFHAFETNDSCGTPLSIVWNSSLDGDFGYEVNFSSNVLSFGTHTITVTAYYEACDPVSDSVTISISNTAPVVTLNSPGGTEEERTFYQGQTIHLQGTSFDETSEFSQLSDDQVYWMIDGEFYSFGHIVDYSGALSLGQHTITFVGSDGIETDADEVIINVIAPPQDLPPDVVIIEPVNGQTLAFISGSRDIVLSWTAVDPEDGELVAEWSYRQNDGPEIPFIPTFVGNYPFTPYWTVTVDSQQCGANDFEFILRATDSAGNTSTARSFFDIIHLC